MGQAWYYQGLQWVRNGSCLVLPRIAVGTEWFMPGVTRIAVGTEWFMPGVTKDCSGHGMGHA